MKKSIISVILIIFALNVYSQNVSYYQDGVNGADNLNDIFHNLGQGFIDTVGIRYEGTKGSPYLFNTMLPSYLLVNGQEKYFKMDCDIDVFNNTVIFEDPSTGKLNEISVDNIKELIFDKYDVQIIYRSTQGMQFDRKMKGNRLCQVILEKPYGLIMVMNKSFYKADNQPTFNSGKHYDEYRSVRKYYLQDSKGVYRRVYFNSADLDYIVHHTPLNKKLMANMYPEKKDLIYKDFAAHSDSVSVNRVIAILNKF